MKKAALIILDGWGIGKNDNSNNAIFSAKTPFYSGLMRKYPNSTLYTFGGYVGLPEGQMGNSEVGHLNLGAGRTVYQMLALINKSMEKRDLLKNPLFQELIKNAHEGDKKIHLLGLVSDGGVHSHISHLLTLCELLDEADCKNVFIHGFTDGRDTDPKSGIQFIKDLQKGIFGKKVKIASIIGRYYAMDRDRRWERIKIAYELLVHGKGERVLEGEIIDSIENSYKNEVSDEFIKPISVRNESGNPIAIIEENDIVLFFNFRTDRGRELTQVLSQINMPDFNMEKLNLDFYTFTAYDKSYENIKVFYFEQNLNKTLGEVVSEAGLKQLRVAETEKYPHVTFFFNGGREIPFDGEERLMVPSPKVATYDLDPKMSAFEITKKTIEKINHFHPDLLVLNYANPDMVGHTGVFSAVVDAIETVDECLSSLIPFLQEERFNIIVIADHGNAEFMVNEDGSPNTSHTTNLVPVLLLAEDKNLKIHQGKLADIAPSLLQLMGIEIPKEMDGKILVY